MNQISFLPVRCNRTIAKPSGVDADFIAVSDETVERYLCKGQSKYPYLPSTEWICSSLARDVGLPVPPFAVIELITNPGIYLFGSQWLGGNVDFAVGLPKVSNPGLFSSVFGMDWFSHNDDRHLGNYLYLEIAGEIVLRPMDFSRAWAYHGWPLPTLPLNSCNTMKSKSTWQNLYGYLRPVSIIEKIEALPENWMEKTLDQIPPAWLDTANRSLLVAWWTTTGRQLRVNEAKSTLP